MEKSQKLIDLTRKSIELTYAKLSESNIQLKMVSVSMSENPDNLLIAINYNCIVKEINHTSLELFALTKTLSQLLS